MILTIGRSARTGGDRPAPAHRLADELRADLAQLPGALVAVVNTPAECAALEIPE